MEVAQANGALKSITRIRELECIIGYTFKDHALLERAMIHASRLMRQSEREYGGTANHNAKLEYIGDGILKAVVRRYLHVIYPHAPFHVVHEAGCILESNAALAYVAEQMNLYDYIHFPADLSVQDRFDPMYRRDIIARAYEAVVGALYLDGDNKAVEAFLNHTLFAEAQF